MQRSRRITHALRTLVATAMLGGALLIVTPPAAAQGSAPANPLSSGASKSILSALSSQLAAPVAPTGKPADLALGAFKPTPKRLLPPRMVANMQGLDAGQKKEAQTLYEGLLDGYDTLLAQNNEERLKNNVAGALMYAITVSHLVLSGEELTEKQQEGLMGNVTRVLSNIAAFKSASDERRQELYEALIISANMALALRQEAAEHPEYEAQAKDLAGTLLRQILGRDDEQLVFTDTGMRFK
ncbi:DUF6683 family protein [Deinococcus apachensis]|uniref:DUF6683 family protein n=1 Tax=Deinococcus apachensis TaxID=309886 RepID=UPI00036D4216|nr:DUF6683 family protein [Deinococcus apachensis]